jgi:hypothetical protein
MIQVSKLVIGIILTILLSSCQFDLNFGEGERGNGNIQNQDRKVTENFTVIKASEGLDVFVTQASQASIKVEADENVINLIKTDIKNGVLKIHTDQNIGRATKSVYISLPKITKLTASSGADLIGKSEIKSDYLEIDASSGADIVVQIDANEVDLDASSGSDIRVSGTVKRLTADASSGSDIKAGDLIAINGKASASSGADILLYVTQNLTANASSGSDIKYIGNPKSVSKNKSVSGSVSHQ